MKLYVGTSGYSYKEWKGKFYPEKLPEKQMLKFYGEKFNTVEINNTFYQMPKTNVLEGWKSQVSDDFKFIIKANQKFTHKKKLVDCEEDLKWFSDNIRTLGKNRGPVLFQFPPYFKSNIDLIKNFLSLFPVDLNAALEFRNISWFTDELYDYLKSKNVALVLSETDENKEPELISTSDWGYLRLRRTDYITSDLLEWYGKIRNQNWKEAYIFFKHEDEGLAPIYAQSFIEISKQAMEV